MKRRYALAGWGTLLVGATLLVAVPARPQDALLVVAHGSRSPEWNERVVDLVSQVRWGGPVGVAFLMQAPPERALDQVAVQLDQTGVDRIIVVPLLVSSFSGHYEEIRYYVGQREDAPGHVNYAPLKTQAELVLTSGMDDHPLISQILLDQIKHLSTESANETVVLVAHGPNEEEDNQRWVERLTRHGERIREALRLRRVEVMTLRDDAPKPVRNAATEQLRGTIERAAAAGRVLVVPVLISVGYLQRQIHERLEGLDYVMSERGLSDHPLAAEWIRQQALQPSAALAMQRPE
ncbi:MAG: sirohydrochlorin chelatase [Terriglobia bacterium]